MGTFYWLYAPVSGYAAIHLQRIFCYLLLSPHSPAYVGTCAFFTTRGMGLGPRSWPQLCGWTTPASRIRAIRSDHSSLHLSTVGKEFEGLLPARSATRPTRLQANVRYTAAGIAARYVYHLNGGICRYWRPMRFDVSICQLAPIVLGPTSRPTTHPDVMRPAQHAHPSTGFHTENCCHRRVPTLVAKSLEPGSGTGHVSLSRRHT